MPVDAPLTLIARRGAYIRIEEAAEAIADMLQQAGLTNIKLQVLETAPYTEIWTAAPKPISPERGILGVNSHGNELLDSCPDDTDYYICEGRSSTLLRPEVDAMQKNALPLGGEARVKAYQEIAKNVYDDFVIVPIGPQLLVRHQQAPGLDAAAGRFHHGQGDDAEGVNIAAAGPHPVVPVQQRQLSRSWRQDPAGEHGRGPAGRQFRLRGGSPRG